MKYFQFGNEDRFQESTPSYLNNPYVKWMAEQKEKQQELDSLKQELEEVSKERLKAVKEADFIKKSKRARNDARLCKRGLVFDEVMPETKELPTEDIYNLISGLMGYRYVREFVAMYSSECRKAREEGRKPDIKLQYLYSDGQWEEIS